MDALPRCEVLRFFAVLSRLRFVRYIVASQQRSRVPRYDWRGSGHAPGGLAFGRPQL